MKRFRKMPVVIEATRLTRENVAGVAEWCGGMIVGNEVSDPPVTLVIPTLEGPISGQMGDWIIRGVAGEFYPCKPDIFEATYEPA